jgi:hypothetical protein
VVGDGAGLRVSLVAELGSAAFAYDPIEAGRDGNVGKQIIAREPLEDGDRPCLRVREGGRTCSRPRPATASPLAGALIWSATKRITSSGSSERPEGICPACPTSNVSST